MIWLIFALFIIGLLALDLLVIHPHGTLPSFRNALYYSLSWLSLGVLVGVGIWIFRGSELGMQYFTGFLLEKALAVDNVFMFVMIFAYFQIPRENQHRVLFWGVIGAIIFRTIFIFLGLSLLDFFSWFNFVLAALLLISAIQMLRMSHADSKKEKFLFKWLSSKIPIDENQISFVSRKQGKFIFSREFLALIAIELTDIIFALDSVPIILAVSRDPFVIISSNVLAILGLRSLYFLAAELIQRFTYLNIGVGLILLFASVKIVLSNSAYALPHTFSLGMILFLLGGSILFSWFKTRPSS
jgi:tellurite resistance protein TerC